MAEGRFDEFVATEIAACFLKHSQGRINYTKLIKMMYIVERYAIKKWGYTLTHDDLFWLKQGPILSRTLDLIRHDDFAKVIWSDFIERHGYDVVLRSDPGREHLSDIVIEAIDAVWEKLGGLDWKAIVEVLHSQLPEKRDLVDGSDRISINELVSGDDPVSDQRVREIHDYHYALSLCSLDSV